MSFDNDYFINADYTKLRRYAQINYLRTKLIKPKSIAFDKLKRIDSYLGFDHRNFTINSNKNQIFSRFKNVNLKKKNNLECTNIQTNGSETDYLGNNSVVSITRKANSRLSLFSFDSYKTSSKDNQDNQSDIRSNASVVRLKIKFNKLARIVCTLLSNFSHSRNKFKTKSIINELDKVIKILF